MSVQSVSMNIDTGEKTWLTPKWIIDVLGAFDLDPCCPDGEMPWRTADMMVRKKEDGLRVTGATREFGPTRHTARRHYHSSER